MTMNPKAILIFLFILSIGSVIAIFYIQEMRAQKKWRTEMFARLFELIDSFYIQMKKELNLPNNCVLDEEFFITYEACLGMAPTEIDRAFRAMESVSSKEGAEKILQDLEETLKKHTF